MLDRRAVNESRFSCGSVRAHTFQVLMQNLACFNRGEHAQLQETFFFFLSLQSGERGNKYQEGTFAIKNAALIGDSQFCIGEPDV